MYGVHFCRPAPETQLALGASAASSRRAATSYRRRRQGAAVVRVRLAQPARARGSPREGEAGFASRCGCLSDSPVSGCTDMLVLFPQEHGSAFAHPVPRT